MEEFIKTLTEADNEIREDIIRKVNNKEKLEDYEMEYLVSCKKIIEKERKKNGSKRI